MSVFTFLASFYSRGTIFIYNDDAEVIKALHSICYVKKYILFLCSDSTSGNTIFVYLVQLDNLTAGSQYEYFNISG